MENKSCSSQPCTAHVGHKSLSKNIHSTSLWGYSSLRKLLVWNTGTTKKIYLMKQWWMLKQTNKQKMSRRKRAATERLRDELNYEMA